MALHKNNFVSFSLLITHSSLYKILASKTLRKVAIKLIEEASIFKGYIPVVAVTRLTKELHYKNKSTVSRALKQLKEMNFITQVPGENWYLLNYFKLQDPI